MNISLFISKKSTTRYFIRFLTYVRNDKVTSMSPRTAGRDLRIKAIEILAYARYDNSVGITASWGNSIYYLYFLPAATVSAKS